MREESVNLLNQIMTIEIVSSIKELVKDSKDIDIILKSLEVNEELKMDMKNSFRDVSIIIDDEVTGIVDTIDTDITGAIMDRITSEDNDPEDEYWGK